MKSGLKIVIALAVSALTAAAFFGCGSDKKDEDTSTGTGSVDFSKDVAPVLTASCTTAGCHDGTTNPAKTNFEDGTKFKATTSLVKISNGSMPPDATTWTDAQKAKVVDYLNGK